MGQVEAAKRLRGSVALGTALLLMLTGQSELLGQQMAYGPGPLPGYGQPYSQPVYTQQPYYQPGYAAQPYNSYSQPSYGYGDSSRTYSPTQAYPPAYQQQYSAPGQSYGPQGNGTAQAGAQGLNAQQLEQLAAPIALYPDTLVAQVLAASTYPAQVSRCRSAGGGRRGMLSPYQIAGGARSAELGPEREGADRVSAGARGDGPEHPVDHRIWATPTTTSRRMCCEAVQVMRQRAQAAGSLQSTPQEPVSYDQGSD